MRIVLGGASGLIGKALGDLLVAKGNDVFVLVRRPAEKPNEISWEPDSGTLAPDAMEGFDAAVLLSGYNIAKKRWNAEVKKLIRDSRVDSASLLAQTLASVEKQPAVFVCASAIGYYGDRGEDLCTEETEVGSSEEFLPGVCEAWEEATSPAVDAGIRTVNLRIGPVLSTRGGALKEMLGPFRLGLGGPIGNGRQWFSWVSIDDVVAAAAHAITEDGLAGPVNVVAPKPVRNSELAKAVGHAIHRPAIVPTPAFVIKILLGQMGVELPLSSTRVSCQKLLDSGFKFKHAELLPALEDLLARGA